MQQKTWIQENSNYWLKYRHKLAGIAMAAIGYLKGAIEYSGDNDNDWCDLLDKAEQAVYKSYTQADWAYNLTSILSVRAELKLRLNRYDEAMADAQKALEFAKQPNGEGYIKSRIQKYHAAKPNSYLHQLNPFGYDGFGTIESITKLIDRIKSRQPLMKNSNAHLAAEKPRPSLKDTPPVMQASQEVTFSDGNTSIYSYFWQTASNATNYFWDKAKANIEFVAEKINQFRSTQQ